MGKRKRARKGKEVLEPPTSSSSSEDDSHLRISPRAQEDAYFRGSSESPPRRGLPELGRYFHRNFVDFDDLNGSNDDVDFNDLNSFTKDGCRARTVATAFGSSVVALSLVQGNDVKFACSGVIFRWDGTTMSILTSAYLVDESIGENKVFVVMLGESFEGELFAHDYSFNLAIVKAKFEKRLQIAELDRVAELSEGENVISLGRHFEKSNLMAAHGKILPIRSMRPICGHLPSSCKITKAGIGGPVLSLTTGYMIGINSFHPEATPFLPMCIVKRCLEHLERHKQVLLPEIGAGVASLDVSGRVWFIEDLMRQFSEIHGVIVRLVRKGSVAEKLGLENDDVISYVDGSPVSSDLEYTAKLLDIALKYYDLKQPGHLEIKVLVKRWGKGVLPIRLVMDGLKPHQKERWRGRYDRMVLIA